MLVRMDFFLVFKVQAIQEITDLTHSASKSGRLFDTSSQSPHFVLKPNMSGYSLSQANEQPAQPFDYFQSVWETNMFSSGFSFVLWVFNLSLYCTVLHKRDSSHCVAAVLLLT